MEKFAKNIGIVCNWPPYPIQSGSNLRLSELIFFLRKSGWCVHLIIVGKKYKGNREILKKEVDFIYSFEGYGLNKLISKIKSIYWIIGDFIEKLGFPHIDNMLINLRRMFRKNSNKQYNFTNYWDYYIDGLSDYLKNISEEKQWLVVIVEYIWLYKCIEKLPKEILKIIDTHDIMHIRYEELKSRNIHFQFEIDEKKEGEIINFFDCAIAIQEEEKNTLIKMKETYKFKFDVIKVGVSGISKKFKFVQNIYEENDLVLFVGGFNEVNILGLQNFISNIWPQLIEEHSNAKLVVCGGICNAFKDKNYSKITFMGYIDSLEQIYQKASIVINPIFFGTGLKIKTIEALSHGKALVTTPTGIEGINESVREVCLVAFDDDDFKRKILFLLKNKEIRENIANSAYKYIQEKLGFDTIYKDLDDYLNKITPTGTETGIPTR